MKAWLVVAVALTACGDRAVAPAPNPALAPPPADAIHKVTESGPVTATVDVWPAAPTLGDIIYYRLTVDADPQVSVAMPFQEQGLGRFEATGFDQLPAVTTLGKRREVQVYQLRAPASGKQRIPPLRLELNDSRQTPPSVVEIMTEEIPVAIAPVDPALAQGELRPIRGELATTVGRRPAWGWIGLGAGATLAVGVWFLLRGRRVRARRRARVSAYDVAMASLRALEARGEPAAEELDAWYVDLSAVVRRYLEGRYQIRAPELTTEEFLALAQASPELSREHQTLLRDFLSRADEVKFAGARPDAGERHATLERARRFIGETRALAAEVHA